MESIRLPYKQDAFGQDVYAKVCWANEPTETGRPIALIFHGGGLMVGSSEMIPKPQIAWLVQHGFVVVIPNYRLVPQVTAKESFGDCEESYGWTVNHLPGLLKDKHDVVVDVAKVVAMGHSTGGTIALHMASCMPLRAVTAFYPTLFTSDPSTSSHKSTSAPPFGLMPDYAPSEEDWTSIKPADRQLSEAPLAAPGTVPAPRNKWQMHILKHGQWLSVACPDGDFGSIDPLTRISGEWPPVIIVQGDADNVPGSSLELVQRAEKEMKAGGVKEVQVEIVKGEAHMFDLPPMVGTSDLGSKWEAVVNGLQFLNDKIQM